jgi:hypothetical protein
MLNRSFHTDKRCFLCPALFFLCAEFFTGLSAVESDEVNNSGVYQTPPVLYVGDKGSLVYTLDIFMPVPESDAVLEGGLPKTDDIIIHKINVDRQGRRVIVDFQAFRTGVVPLPPIPFGDREIKGLQVNIASILDSKKSTLTLSPAAGPIAAPGTFWIITAFSVFTVTALLALVLLYAKSGVLFSNMRNTLRTRFLLYWINARLRRVEKHLRLGKLSEKEALSGLSNEVRDFLSRFWMQPCYAMTSEEFLSLSIPGAADSGKLMSDICAFFKRCDKIRFGGPPVESGGNAAVSETVSAICSEAKTLVNIKVPVKSGFFPQTA